LKRLVIVATKYRHDPEAVKIFEERNWQRVRDESTVPAKKKLVGSEHHSTPLIDVSVEEYEYE
jgi:hypothetical protein